MKRVFMLFLATMMVLGLATVCFGANVALDKPVTYSSQQSGNEADHINDGNTSNRWSAEDYPQWVRIDLGSTYSINKVEVLPYSNRAYRYKVEISTNGSTYSTVVDRTNNTTGGSVISDTFTAQSARYVRLTVTGCYNYSGGWASIREFRVFNVTTTATPTPSASTSPSPSPSASSSTNIKLNSSVEDASADDGNVPSNVLDGSLSTRFSSNGDGAYITLDTNGVYTISNVKIAWHNGSTRTFFFEIFVSNDNSNFTKVYPASGNASSSGSTTSLENYDFTDVSSRYVKVVGHENTYNTWFSPTEIEVWGRGGTPASPLPTPSGPIPTTSVIPTPTATPSSTPSPTPTSNGTVYNVGSTSQWNTAVANVQPGDTIRVTANLSSGVSIKNKTATASNPITIIAASPQTTSLYYLSVENCQGIVVQGFKFGPNSAGTLLKVVNSKNVRILRNYFDHNNISASQSSIVTTQASQYIEVAYNTFDRKNVGSVSGSYIKTQYDEPNITKNMHIHHNYFKNIVPMPSGGGFDGDSDRETIVLGISDSQGIMTDHTIEYNLFEDCDGENEIITVKTSRNIIRYNTFKNCLGSVSVRFGTQTQVYGNFFQGTAGSSNNFETGGIRIYGSYHKIYNNYFENLTGTSYRVPICVDGGDTSDSSSGDGHERPTYCEVGFNTIVNCAWGIGVGMNYSLSPQNCKISNNIVSNSQNQLFTLTRCDATNLLEGNIAWPTGSATVGVSRSQNEIWVTDPQFTTVNNLKKLSSTSPAINYGKGTYSYVTADMDGQSRSTRDCGADEYSTAAVTIRPLTSADVGYSAP